MNRFGDFLQRALVWFKGLPPHRRTSLLVSVALSFALTAALWGYAAYDPMVVLFPRPLDAKSTASVLDFLEQNEIPHRIEPGSSRVYVPRSQRDRVSVELRGSSLISGNVGGMDMIENAPIGTTQFMERRRWTMALQKEIESQINGFDQVVATKVLLSVPEESLFAEDNADPSASVYVELKTGAALSADEGSRIASLVAAAVPRLAPDRVEILDSELRVIHAMRVGDLQAGMSAELATLRRQYDAYYTGKVERLLERIVGPGKVVAQVNVELDHTERTVRQRELDGEGAVVISQRSREATSAGGGSGGVPGTTSNASELGKTETTGRSTNEADEVANVDVPDKQTHIASLPGGILGLTASVIVDGTWEAAAVPEGEAAAADGDAAAVPEKVYKPRSAEEMAQYAEVVAAAIGTPVGSVTVINQPFAQLDLTPEGEDVATAPVAASYLPWGAAALALVLTFLFVIRPAMKTLSDSPLDQLADDAGRALEGSGVAGALEEPEVDPREQEQEALAEWLQVVASGDRGFVTRGEVTRLVKADLVHSVVTLQTWITKDVE